jgi:hypothetical protein
MRIRNFLALTGRAARPAERDQPRQGGAGTRVISAYCDLCRDRPGLRAKYCCHPHISTCGRQ